MERVISVSRLGDDGTYKLHAKEFIQPTNPKSVIVQASEATGEVVDVLDEGNGPSAMQRTRTEQERQAARVFFNAVMRSKGIVAGEVLDLLEN